MKIFKFCNKYLKKHKIKLTAYVLIGFITTLIGIITTYLIGEFLDQLTIGGEQRVVLTFALIFIALNVVKIVFGYLSTILYINMQLDMGNELNRDAISHIQGLSLTYTNQVDTAYLNQSVNNDSNGLIIFCITIIQNIIVNIITIVVPFIILLFMNAMIAIVFLSFVILYVFVYKAFKKTLHQVSFEFRESQSHFFASLYEQFQHIKLIKTNGVQEEVNQRLHKNFNNIKTKGLKEQKVNYFFSSVDQIIGIGAQMVLFTVGGLQVLNGNFTIGMFTVFSIYFNMMLSSSRYFFNLGAVYQSQLVSYERLNKIFQEKTEKFGKRKLNSIETICFDKISFSYREKKIFESLDMSFEKGKIYAIVGSNGKGKTTLINLLLGMYLDEKQGEVLYNGLSIKEFDLVYLRKKMFGFSEQEPVLMQDTIRYNLAFGQTVDDAQLETYLKLLNMKKFIDSLDNGVDSIINEKNTNISGGEKQKISILKVLLKQPDVMIFDEPSSALDTDTAQNFVNHLRVIKHDKLIILITHDPFIKNIADIAIEL